MNTEKVTRIEVIEKGKRQYVKWDCKPVFMLQDGGRTLKIFIDVDDELKKKLKDASTEVEIEITN